nr:alpha-2-macroglobulin-like protein 1 [Pelodiscus sinensis]|eukprot:XP_025040751.1 alpha-2-macroglobulin-like protein 1 [Pelodiscus sinensis]
MSPWMLHCGCWVSDNGLRRSAHPNSTLPAPRLRNNRFEPLTESDGCLSWEVGTAPFHLTRSDYQMNLEAMASLVEEGTGVVINATRSCLINIVSEIATVTFEEADAAYRAGIPYTGKMLLKAADGSALKNETLRLFVSSGDISENQTFLTDESGRASFTLDTSGWTGTVALRGNFKQAGPSEEHDGVSPCYPDAHHRVEPFYSRSRSFLKIRRLGGELPCNQVQWLHVDYVLAREALGRGSKSLDFIFLVRLKCVCLSVCVRSGRWDHSIAHITLQSAMDVVDTMACTTTMAIVIHGELHGSKHWES